LIAEALGLPREPTAAGQPPSTPPGTTSQVRYLRGRVLRHAGTVAGGAVLSARVGRRLTLLGYSGFLPRDTLRLAAKVRGLRAERPFLSPGLTEIPHATEAPRRRLEALRDESAPPLEHLVRWLLPALLPRSVVEGYEQLVATSRRRYGRPSHLLIGNYAADELQNEYIARSRAAGRRVAFSQHGGFYLQAVVNAAERLEIRPDADFLSWGATGDRIRPLPTPRLERIRGTHQGGSAVVIVEFLEPPDSHPLRLASQPMANQAFGPSRMLTELVEFVGRARPQLVLKRFPSHLDPHRRRPAALEALPHAFAPGGAVDWMRQARVAVIPYPDTPFIEALVLGVPTVGLWDPALWELRDDARAPFDALTEAGVIHSDPKAAAAHVDAIYDDPSTWWDAPATRAARDAFIERFARPGDWLPAWSAYLRDLGA
jgi:putative transferase (TIGR04331 family)